MKKGFPKFTDLVVIVEGNNLLEEEALGVLFMEGEMSSRDSGLKEKGNGWELVGLVIIWEYLELS